MTNDAPTSRPASRKVQPIAIIVVVVLVALAIIAFAGMRGATHPPRGGPSAPQGALLSGAPSDPAPSTVPNTQQPASDERGAMGHHDNANEPGGPATTANTTGNAPR